MFKVKYCWFLLSKIEFLFQKTLSDQIIYGNLHIGFHNLFGKVVITNKLHRESCCTWRERKIERCKYYNQILFDGAQTVKASK